jgi:TonB family protein
MTALKSFWPLIVVALLGLTVIIVAEPISNWINTSRTAPAGFGIGRIARVEGSVRRIHGATIETISSPVELRDGDRVQTSANSKAEIVLNSQDEMELGPSSAVEFQLWNPKDSGSPIYMNSMLGTLTAQKPGVRGKAYLVKEGRLYLPGQKPLEKAMALTVLRNAPLDLHLAQSERPSDFEVDTEEQATPPAGLLAEPETLSNEYIDETILGHQSLLQKCWLTRLKDAPTLKGQIVVQFEISRRGKVKEMRVADSSLNDEVLQKCVMSVIERIAFRPYKGSEISLSYPINFE